MARIFITLWTMGLLAQMALAQKAKLLEGKWEFKDIANKEKLDTTLLKQATISFGKTIMEFYPNGTMTYNPLGNNQFSVYQGTWTLNKEQTKLSAVFTYSSNKQQTAEWEVIGLTEKELKLNMGLNTIVAFRKAPLAPVITEKKVEPPKKTEPEKEPKITKDVVTPVQKKDSAPDPTVFVARINDYNVFKVGSYFGLKDLNNNIVFPAVLSSIKQDMAQSFEITISGKHIENAYFGVGGFTGKMNCDVCDGSGYVNTTFHISEDRKVSTSRVYLGNGVWKEVTTTTIIPAYDAKEDTPCRRCDGMGMMRGGVSYQNESINIWYWKDELNKRYKN